jgi:hypothetical protein
MHTRSSSRAVDYTGVGCARHGQPHGVPGANETEARATVVPLARLLK